MSTDQNTVNRPITQAGDTRLGTASKDHHLLDRIADGDRQAFACLYVRYRPRIQSYLRRRLHNPENLDEVLNDVMMIIWQKPTGRPPHVPLLAWFYGIARYTARKYDRRTSSQDAEIPEFATEGAEPEVHCLTKDREKMLKRAISRLPHHERQPIELLIYHGYAYKDIAAQLETPLNTIVSRIRRAEARLKTTLSNQD